MALTVNLDTQAHISFTLEELIGQRTAVLGVSGSGKTNTIADLAEELLAGGVPLTIVDIEGEYWGLKERYQILIAGQSEQAELKVGVAQAESLAQMSYSRRISVILDFSEMSNEEMQQFLLAYLSKLWQLSGASGKARQPYGLIVEEAQEFIPQGGRTPVKEILNRVALRGRKRGLFGIIASQRPQNVDKSFLSQATLFFLHRVVYPNDMAVYKDLIPLPPKEVEQTVGKLSRGEVILLSNNEATRVQMRVRHTYHPSSNPSLEPEGAHKLLTIDKAFLADLQNSLVKTKPNLEVGNSPKNENRVKELEEETRVQAEEIERLRRELALVSQLKISFEGLANGVALLQTTSADKLEINTATIEKLITADGSINNSGRDSQREPEQEERERAITQATKLLITQIEQWKNALAGESISGGSIISSKDKDAKTNKVENRAVEGETRLVGQIANVAAKSSSGPVNPTNRPAQAPLVKEKEKAQVQAKPNQNQNQGQTHSLSLTLSRGEERQLENLIALVKRQSLIHRRIFTELVHQEEVAQGGSNGLSLRQLKARTNYKFSNLEKHPPYELINAGLLRKEGTGSQVTLFSNLEDYLVANFKGVEPEVIRERLRVILEK